MNSSVGEPVFQEIKCPQCGRRAPFDVAGSLCDSIVQFYCRRCNRLLQIAEGQRIVVVKEGMHHLP